MKRTRVCILVAILSIVSLSACGKTESESFYETSTSNSSASEPIMTMTMTVASSHEDEVDTAQEIEALTESPMTSMEDSENINKRIISAHEILDDFSDVDDKYTRLSDDSIGRYKAESSNGYVFPYVISHSVQKNETGKNIDVYTYGFVDETGTIVSDYGYESVTKDKDYWVAVAMNEKENYEEYHISLDGKNVIKTLISGNNTGVVVREYGERIYEISYIIDDTSDSYMATTAIRKRIYALDGNVRDVKYIETGDALAKAPITIPKLDFLYVAPTDILDGQYLKLLSNVRDISNTEPSIASNATSIVDLDEMSIILKEYYSVKMFENHTFAARKYEDSRNILYNCLGQPINDDTFFYIEYLADDYYLVKDGENTVSRIVKLENGEFTKVKTLEAGSYYEADGFIATKNEETYGSQSFYHYDGTEVTAETNAAVRRYENALYKGDVWYEQAVENPLLSHGSITGTKDYEDSASVRTLNPKYYGFEAACTASNQDDVTYRAIVDMDDDNVLFAVPSIAGKKNGYIETVQNGIALVDNQLIDVNTKELIFKYTVEER